MTTRCPLPPRYKRGRAPSLHTHETLLCAPRVHTPVADPRLPGPCCTSCKVLVPLCTGTGEGMLPQDRGEQGLIAPSRPLRDDHQSQPTTQRPSQQPRKPDARHPARAPVRPHRRRPTPGPALAHALLTSSRVFLRDDEGAGPPSPRAASRGARTQRPDVLERQPCPSARWARVGSPTRRGRRDGQRELWTARSSRQQRGRRGAGPTAHRPGDDLVGPVVTRGPQLWFPWRP